MKRPILLAIAFAGFLTRLLFAIPGISNDSPTGIVQEFLAMETSGGRLSPEGWHKADKFFAHSARQPDRKQVLVISNNYSVYENWKKGNRAEVFNDCTSLGRIDASLRYSPPKRGVFKTTGVYRLIRASDPASPNGAVAWKIEEPPVVLWLTKEAAIRYITQTRDRTNDPSLRQNADRTLEILKRYH